VQIVLQSRSVGCTATASVVPKSLLLLSQTETKVITESDLEFINLNIHEVRLWVMASELVHF
jgi:hypothetical protein